MELATTTGDFYDYCRDQAEILPILKECGFTNVDYSFCSDHARKNGFYSDDVKGHLKKLQSSAAVNNIKFVQAHAPMGKPLVDTEEMISVSLRAIEASAELGIKNIVVHSGYAPGLTKAETFARNRDFFMPLLKRADELDVNVLCENFDRMVSTVYWIDNATDLREFLDFVDHPRLRACWDMGHGNLQKQPQHESIKLLGKYIYAVHVQDNLGNDDTHMCPFFGTLNLDSVMYGLREINYQGYFTFEVGKLPYYWAPRAEFKEDTRLLRPTLELKMISEKYLHSIGEYILKTSCDW